jgi:hypothetical protein
VIHYLNRHKSLGLRFAASANPLEGYSDSDWAVHRSMSGCVFMYGSAAVTWGAKKQACVALSSCEAEIIAGSEATKEAVYLIGFLKELGLADDRPVKLKMDNKAAIDLAYNPEHHQRTKHIERRHFFIRDMVEECRIEVPFVPTHENLADFFTKPLSSTAFFPLRDRIMNVPGARARIARARDIAPRTVVRSTGGS